MDIGEYFIDVSALPDTTAGFVQVLFLGVVYGYVLMQASQLISDGSELLLLVPSVSGIVGSVVLPVLGAVPDGCIVLFSGMGPNAQEQLTVGVGALAGSTIMLLTVPWILSILGGRVNVVNGKAVYASPKLPSPDYLSLFDTGVAVSKAVNKGAYFMLITSIPYLFVQIPGLFYLNDSSTEQAKGEHNWAMFGLILCISFMSFYLYYQYRHADDSSEDNVMNTHREEMMRDAIQTGKLSLLGVMLDEFKLREPRSNASFKKSKGYNAITDLDSSVDQESLSRLERILKPFFKKYDRNGNGTLDMQELAAVFQDLGENVSPKELSEIFVKMDKDSSGSIDYSEFVSGVATYVINHSHLVPISRQNSETEKGHFQMTEKKGSQGSELSKAGESEGEDEDEEEEMPEDLKDLSPEEQQRRIKLRSMFMMGFGTLIALVFSDPMVDVLTEIGNRIGVSPFYVSFVLAPLASNASEVIASYSYAQKKTTNSITISLSTLEGAAVMNNSFVLGIFMFLIVFKGLAWEFFAETATILLVQFAVALMALKKTHTVFDGLVILSFYPLSLFLVSYLESIGWD